MPETSSFAPLVAAPYSVAEFATHLDFALHQPSLTADDIRAGARLARESGVAAFYTNTAWTELVAAELAGSGVRVGAAVGFPFGNGSTAAKLFEAHDALDSGATAVDMVVNIGAWRAGDAALVARELDGFVARCSGRAICKVIFEVRYLSDDEIAGLARLCVERGVDYVKTATSAEGAPTERQVEIMLDAVEGSATRVKVSGVPRTFTLPAVLHMLDRGVDLVGTSKAAELIADYRLRFAPGIG